MPDESTTTYCGGCEAKLDEPSDLPIEDRKPCDTVARRQDPSESSSSTG